MKARQKCALRWQWGRHKKAALKVPRPQDLTAICRDGVVSPGKLGYVSLTVRDWAVCQQLLLYVRWGGLLALDGHSVAVIFFGLQDLQVARPR